MPIRLFFLASLAPLRLCAHRSYRLGAVMPLPAEQKRLSFRWFQTVLLWVRPMILMIGQQLRTMESLGGVAQLVRAAES